MNQQASESRVAVANKQRKVKIDIPRYQAAVAKILELLGVEDRELSVMFVSDRKMRELNRQYRRVDRSTDVISFPMAEGESGEVVGPLLGDMILSLETIARQASEPFEDDRPWTGTFRRELALMTIHGICHLLGYDHETGEDDAREMVSKERELFGITWQYFPEIEGEQTPIEAVLPGAWGE